MKKFYLPIYFLIAVWSVFIIDFFLPIRLNQYGIYPRHVNGLIGILFCPFLHANLHHVICNSLPLFVLLSITTYFFRKNNLTIVFSISILGGLLVWVFGRSSYHVGASLLVFGLASFIIFFGIFEKKILPIILSIIVFCLYGTSLLIGLLPIFPGVSWEGHLCGLIAGIIVAKQLAKK
jgi:membrane associated rhomboid family serine protease